MKRMNRQSGLTTIKFLGLTFLLFVAVLLGTAFALAIVIGPPSRVLDPTVITTPTTSVAPETPPVPKHATNAMVTKGNYSWVRLNLEGSIDQHSNTILGVMETFEKANPDLEVIGWSLQEQNNHFNDFYFYGIWVHHRKR